jgi:hypothetical protein
MYSHKTFKYCHKILVNISKRDEIAFKFNNQYYELYDIELMINLTIEDIINIYDKFHEDIKSLSDWGSMKIEEVAKMSYMMLNEKGNNTKEIYANGEYQDVFWIGENEVRFVNGAGNLETISIETLRINNPGYEIVLV